MPANRADRFGIIDGGATEPGFGWTVAGDGLLFDADGEAGARSGA